MRQIVVVGIGAGNPDHITVQAIKALNRLDVVFVLDKGAEKDELAQLRRELCDRYITARPYRMVEIPDPPRDRLSPDYLAGVDDWHERRAALYEAAIARELGESETGGILAWGDPSLYDSTIRILERVRAREVVRFDYEVIPGITSLQALTAAHRATLNEIGGEVRITTGRRLNEQPVAANTSVAVMLDGGTAFQNIEAPEDTHILWGAYVGTPREILVSGRLTEVADEIVRLRDSARAEAGWIMDAYILKRLRKGQS